MAHMVHTRICQSILELSISQLKCPFLRSFYVLSTASSMKSKHPSHRFTSEKFPMDHPKWWTEYRGKQTRPCNPAGLSCYEDYKWMFDRGCWKCIRPNHTNDSQWKYQPSMCPTFWWEWICSVTEFFNVVCSPHLYLIDSTCLHSKLKQLQ